METFRKTLTILTLQALSLLRLQWKARQLSLLGGQWGPSSAGDPGRPALRAGRGDESRQQGLRQRSHPSLVHQGGGGGQHMDSEGGDAERETFTAGREI